jgi:hypothetical protein
MTLLLQARRLILTALKQPSRASTVTGARSWQTTTHARAGGSSSTTGTVAAGSMATSGSGESSVVVVADNLGACTVVRLLVQGCLGRCSCTATFYYGWVYF